jgi:phospholipid/cholesterol/gamma-HCH transport system substrate-binding protein
MQKNIHVMVGLFVILGALALVFLSLRVSNLSGSGESGPRYTVSAAFDNIGGLKPRAAVKSAGVVVGRVREIRLDPQTYQALVVMDLSQGVPFPRDTSAKILTSGLLGEQYIGLTPGADLKMLAHNDRIQMTQSAVVLENLISQFLYNRNDSGSNSEPSSPKGL